MINIDAKNHVTGRSVYLDDIPVVQGTLYALIFDSGCAHGKIKSIDYSDAEALKGVVKIITHRDIRGENQIGGIIPDEPLLAIDEVHFWGMPVAIIVAESESIARKAKKLIRAEYEPLPVITDPREAKEKGKLIVPPRTFKIGNAENIWDSCKYVFSGRADSNGQEHLYIETQGAYAIPAEGGNIKLYSSTQGPTAVQRTAAKVLGVGMHKVEVDVTRLGGGFGGKEDQATMWAVCCAVAASILQRPVKYSVNRMDDMRISGKRHPYSSDYKIGLDENLKITAYEVTFYQNAGAAADLSPAVMERTMFHATNSYYIPNATITAYSCKTNLPPNTAFRGFGGPQGMFVIESAIVHAATELNIDASEIQKANLLRDGNELPYGQVMQRTLAHDAWNMASSLFGPEKMRERISQFNKTNALKKKGMSMQPICFGISFTNTPMNNARALVHVYQDGSVGVSTGGVEMGQGLNTKMIQVAADIFQLNPSRIKIETTNTTRVANTSPSAASATADLNGKATELACEAIASRLLDLASRLLETPVQLLSFRNEMVCSGGQETELTWDKLVQSAMLNRVSLSESAHYATPEIHFDKTREKGHPFAYHVYGVACTEVTVDCLRGTYHFDSVRIVHDFGKSMNSAVDLGQIEGGLIQGIGWMTMEDLRYNADGRLLSNALSTYKIPDIYSVPSEVIVHALPSEGHEYAIRRSKAVGEPPLMYGLGAYFAIRDAVKAFNPQFDGRCDAPFTPEKVLMSLYNR